MAGIRVMAGNMHGKRGRARDGTLTIHSPPDSQVPRSLLGYRYCANIHAIRLLVGESNPFLDISKDRYCPKTCACALPKKNHQHGSLLLCSWNPRNEEVRSCYLPALQATYGARANLVHSLVSTDKHRELDRSGVSYVLFISIEPGTEHTLLTKSRGGHREKKSGRKTTYAHRYWCTEAQSCVGAVSANQGG